MTFKARRNNLLSQRIEVALVYKDMLGLNEARDYLNRESVPAEIVERVLLTERRRRPPQAPHGNGGQAALVCCRRTNHVHDAIVEAALKLESKLGAKWALALLKDENVSETVASRIMAEGPRQIRARRLAR